MVRITNFSYGGTAGIVASLSLIVGLDAATATKATIVSGLLVLALADNLTDALSIHMYQESEQLEARKAFKSVLFNFGTRFLVASSFVLIFVLLPVSGAVYLSVAWGLVLLASLTLFIARQRRASVISEVFKHISVALTVILVSRGIGGWIQGHLQ